MRWENLRGERPEVEKTPNERHCDFVNSVSILYSNWLSRLSLPRELTFFSFYFHSSWSIPEEDRSSLPKQDTAEEKETEDQLHEVADRRVGETFSQTEILGVGWKSSLGEVIEDDGCPGEDLVSEQTNEMEVSTLTNVYYYYFTSILINAKEGITVVHGCIACSVGNSYVRPDCRRKTRDGNRVQEC